MVTQSFHPFRSEQAKTEYTGKYFERSKAWPVPSETRLVKTSSGETFVRMSGRVGDPPLVLLPGARGTTLMWIRMIAALSSCHRTYALDTMADVGLSVPRIKISTPEDLLRWLDEVFQVLVPEGRLSVMGMSYGGWLAGLYALHFPDRLEKVILLAPGSTVHRLSFAFFASVLFTLIPLPGNRGGTILRMCRWLFRDTLKSGEAGRKIVEEEVPEQLAEGRYFELPRLVWPTVLTDDELRDFKVPGLLLIGENEKIYSPAAAVKRVNRLAPAIKTEIVPGAGHDLTIVQADLVARKALEFLARPVYCAS